MNFKAIVKENDNSIIKSIYKLLNIKPGDIITWELKDETVQLKKVKNSVPVSCRSLTKEELEKELLKGIDAVKKGETIPAKQVDKMLLELDEI